MRNYTKRVQTVLTDEQHQMLTQLAAELNKPISVVIREAVKEIYFEKTALQRRRAALKKLLSLNAPVADWGKMEEDIIRGTVSE